MKSQFGERVRKFRESRHLYLRHIAPLLEMDTAQVSKIEKGNLQLKREQIPILADILKVESDELLTLWVADQIIDVASGEDVALKAMEVAEMEILRINKKKENSVN